MPDVRPSGLRPNPAAAAGMTEEEQAERRPQVEELQDVLRQALREGAVEWEEAAEFAQGVLELSTMVGAREPAWLKAVAIGEEPSLDLPGEEQPGDDEGADERAGEWPGDELDPRPYEMSRREWRNARHGERPEYAHQGLTRRSGAEEVARVANYKELGFGVKKPIDPESEGRPPVRHRDVVELALRLGRDVPADVLDQHPDLEERRRELGREGVTVNIVDSGQTVKRREVAEAERRGQPEEAGEVPEPKTVQSEEEREGGEEDETRRMADVDSLRSLKQGNNVEGEYSTTGYEHLPYDTLEDWVRVFDAINRRGAQLSKGARPRLRRHLEELPEEIIERATDTGVLKGAKSRVERLKPPRGKRKGDVTTELINDLHNRRQALENQEREGSEEDAAPSEWGQEIIEIPTEELRTDEERFQPRGGDYSEETARRVAENFDPNLFEPIRAWQDDGGAWFVLAGHSRLEGMRRRDAETIPVRPFEGSEEEAIRFALTENDKGDQLTNAERATYIRRLRAQGATKKEQKQEAKRLYGRDASTVVALSYLDPDGKALDVLSRLQSNATGEGNDVETMCVWIGKLRRYHPELDDSHEREIWNYLEENYKTEGRELSSFVEFREHVEEFIERRSMFGELDGPLNFAEIQPKSQQEREIDRQVEEAREALRKARRERKAVEEEYAGQDLSPEEWERVVGPANEDVKIAQDRLLEMKQRAKEGRHDLASTEMGLFDNLRSNPSERPKGWPRIEPCAIVNANEAQDGIEIRFPDDPGEEVLDVVREAGFLFYTPTDAPDFWAAKSNDERDALACALDAEGNFCTRANPSIESLATLGRVERLDTTAGAYGPREGEGELDYAFVTFPSEELLVVPAENVEKVEHDPDRSPEATAFYEKWAGHAGDGAPDHDYRVTYDRSRVVNAGHAETILYHSDKREREGDRAGLMHRYLHRFDPGQRPATMIGPMMLISAVEVDPESGIMN